VRVESLLERNEIIFLSEGECRQVGLTMEKAIDIIEDVFRAQGLGRTWVPDKTSVRFDLGLVFEKFVEGHQHFTAMPGYVGSIDTVGIKWIGQNWQNTAKHGLPSLIGMIILNDPETVMPLAIVGAGWLTAMRTGAASAVAAKYLGRRDSKTLCIIGAGYQSMFQLDALDKVLDLDEVRIVDIKSDAMENFKKGMTKRTDLTIVPEPNREKAVRGSDVVVTCTVVDIPMVKRDWIKEGVLILAIGSYPNLDYDVVKSMDKIVVDHLLQTRHAGELSRLFSQNLISERDIYGELGDIVVGKKKGRESDEDILMVPIGMASEDLAVAHETYKLAKARGMGQKLAWTW